MKPLNKDEIRQEARIVHTFEECYGFSSCSACSYILWTSDLNSAASIPKECPGCGALLLSSFINDPGGSDFN
ncbi:MAG: hypothetical protein R3346_02580 [Candidatus Spechtbacterales bacterium]|nr:hypothetical protein [Candidatus Spechtbacterales bacterium]